VSKLPAPAKLEHGVPLSPLTTLGLGGAARCFIAADDDETLIEALAWARDEGLPVALLGGGSNVVVPDAGVDGVVIALRMRGVTSVAHGDRVHITAAAGEPWDELVERCVQDDLAGIECLSGIPGLVGATPLQNVGAYGQEVGSTIASVRVLERATLQQRVLTNAECDFSYRYSALKRDPNRYAVLAVTFALHKGGAPAIRYQELVNAFAAHAGTPSLAEARSTVIALRRNKSMVYDPSMPDENTRSAGSFFLNPIIPVEQADALAARLVAEGRIPSSAALPRYPGNDPAHSKLAAAWLIEAAGFRKGERNGNVGISTKHSLGLVCHEGATTAELLGFARVIETQVHTRLGVRLEREPVLLGG
jgi:UDP-N-acetylmuramate dehydrogenase